jgi:hypothetical protein
MPAVIGINPTNQNSSIIGDMVKRLADTVATVKNTITANTELPTAAPVQAGMGDLLRYTVIGGAIVALGYVMFGNNDGGKKKAGLSGTNKNRKTIKLSI